MEGLNEKDIDEQFPGLLKKIKSIAPLEKLENSYFDDLETPIDVSKRMMEFIFSHVLEKPAGQTVLLVTHSMVLNSLLAVHHGKDFERILTRRLCWIKLGVHEDFTFVFRHTEDISTI